ncbi:uncharacterized protein LOC134258393 isoform X2 [Saccostrea cucullata]
MKKSGGCLESKETSIDTIHQVKDLRCCMELCLEKLDVKTIEQARRDFYMKKRDEQTEFIFNSLRCSYAHVEKGSKVTFVAFGVRLCQTGWRALYGVKPRRYWIIKAKVKEGCQSLDTEDGRSGQKFASEMYLQAKTYVETTAVRYGDQQPDCREVHLPCCLNKTIAYEDYLKTFQDRGLHCVSKRSFYRIWREHFNNVKVRKFQKFSKCNECTTFREALSQKLTKEERLRLQAQRQIHLKFQELSREKYYKHRSKSRENPAKYTSLIIDNMDQSKTNLPRFPENFKSETGLTHIHHHVTGVLNHGINKSYVYTWTDQFSSDCNITLNCLMLVLKDTAMINNGSLPPVLYLQADNSPKDNKNKFVIMFLAMLVKADILKKIKLTFLMVGHTHEDIDQMFSCISREAHTQKIITLTHLHEMVEKSFCPKPEVQHLDNLWDFRGMTSMERSLRGIKEPHVFKISKKSGRVMLSYKDWPISQEVYRDVDLHDLVPGFADGPDVVEPNFTKINSITEDMRRDLPRWAETGRFTASEVDWWTSYLTSMQKKKEDRPLPIAPSTLPRYSALPRTESVLETNLHGAINRHMERLQRSSRVQVSGRGVQHS